MFLSIFKSEGSKSSIRRSLIQSRASEVEGFFFKPGTSLISKKVFKAESNNEKELPEAFLRRCFFHYIQFPELETLKKIVKVHFPEIKKSLLNSALQTFFEIRETPGLKKKPSTSEALDWIKLLLIEDLDPSDLKSNNKDLLPKLHGALIKNEQDIQLFEQLAFMSRNAR